MTIIIDVVIRCLAHIINLTTQALILTKSKAKYYNPHNVDKHLPDLDMVEQDELGLVCTISVKVHMDYLLNRLLLIL